MQGPEQERDAVGLRLGQEDGGLSPTWNGGRVLEKEAERAFPWGSYEGLCQGRTVPTCFEIMAFQMLEEQLGMPGWQVRRKTGEETSRGHPQSVNRPPNRKLPANRPKPENRTPVPEHRKGRWWVILKDGSL